MSRLWIFRKLPNDQVLFMEVPQAGGLWLDLEDDQQPDPRWSDPAYVTARLRPPAQFLPEFYSIDDIARPTVIEAYVSELYFDQPYARLKIIEPIRLEFVERSEEAHRVAMAQAKSEPNVDLANGNDGRWWAPKLLLADKELWTRFPKIVGALASGGSSDVILFGRKTADEILVSAGKDYNKHWLNARSWNYGVPQPKRFPRPLGEGMLYHQATGFYGDEVIPLACATTPQIVCHSLLDRRGYLLFYKMQPSRPAWTLDYRGHAIDLGSVGAFYDRSAKQLFIVSGEQL
jgi:hypothetical protein